MPNCTYTECNWQPLCAIGLRVRFTAQPCHGFRGALVRADYAARALDTREQDDR
jgi:hypothetical protein